MSDAGHGLGYQGSQATESATIVSDPIRRLGQGAAGGDTVEAVTRDQVLRICASFPGAVEDYPFGQGVAVFKVGGRMFALVSLDGEPGSVNLKCEPEFAVALRARYAAIRPGYHQNKRHWNTVELDGTVPDRKCRDMIDHSYELVVGRLPRAEQARLIGR